MRAVGVAVGLAAAIAIALAGCASEPPKPRKWNPNGGPVRSEDWHSPTAMLMRYDADHDGTLTREELEAGLRAEFNGFDKHHNGCLDSDEVQAINESRISADNSAASPLIDWNHDGCVDFNEYATTLRSLFAQLDADNDGKITPDELHGRGHRAAAPSPAPTRGGGY